MSTLAYCTKSLVLVAALLLGRSSLLADTVYLKNGNWIDGIVEPREGNKILLVIGKLGKLEISLEDVYEIEKNSRTGSELHVPVDTRDLAVADEDPSDDSTAEDPEEDGTSVAEEDSPDREAEVDLLDEDMDPELRIRLEKLVADLKRQKSKYRVRAERHLKAAGPVTIPFLLPLVKNESDLVRISVFRLFQSFGDDRVVDASIDALLDSNEYVRDHAHRALQRISGEDFGYVPLASPRRREHAQAKWKKWWAEEKEAIAELESRAKS